MNALQSADLSLIDQLTCLFPLWMMPVHEGFHDFQFGPILGFFQQILSFSSC